MTKRSLVRLWTLLLLSGAGSAFAQSKDANNATVTAVASEATRRGLAVVQQSGPQDLDGDGKPEVAAAAKNEDGDVVLAIFRVTAPGRVTHVWTSPSTNADELKNLELRNMVAEPRPEVVLELLEHAPDETRRLLKVYRADDGGVREILSLAHRDEEREITLDRVSYGDDEPGYRITDLEGDGNQEVMIRREPKAVKVKGRSGAIVTLVTGVRESVFAWDRKAKGGKYVAKQDRVVNFIPARAIQRVTASSQALPDDIRQAEQDRALEASFNQAFENEKGKSNPLTDDPAPVNFNPAPRAFWAADNNLETSWQENAKGTGEGEWVAVDLGEQQDIRMVRVIPVCAASESEMKANNELTAFTLQLGGTQRIVVDRTEKDPSDANVLAVLEVPAPDAKFAPQVLVFLQKGLKASQVRLVIDKAKRRGRGNQTCVAEISVH